MKVSPCFLYPLIRAGDNYTFLLSVLNYVYSKNKMGKFSLEIIELVVVIK